MLITRFKAQGESVWTTLPKVHYKGLTKISITGLDECLRICLYVEWCNVVTYDREATLPCAIQTNSIGVEECKDMKDSVTSYVMDKFKLVTGEF